jgi:hypothetical protein
MKRKEESQTGWQRKWRSESGKIGATIYLNRHEIDILDWLVHRVMDADPRPEAVGRPAALRRLLAEIEEEYADEIAAWALAALEPAERASFYQQELGRRRRGPQRAKYEHLSRIEQQRIARRAMARIRNEARRRDEAKLMHEQAEQAENGDDGELPAPKKARRKKPARKKPATVKAKRGAVRFAK